MSYRTFGDLRSQVEAEVDTEGEEFVTDPEIMRYFNSAVVICEAAIVKLGLREKYLQAEAYISTIQNQTDYALPADIVANKVRKVIYRNGTIIYQMKPMFAERGYEIEDVSTVNPPNEYYHFSMYKSGEDTIFRITPRALQNVTNAIRLIYMKALNRYTADSINCNVPDICYEFIMSYVRYRIYAKESAGNANTQDEKSNMQMFNTLMQETLQNQIADPDADLVEADQSHYWDMN